MKRLEKKKSDYRRPAIEMERLFIALQLPLELRRALHKNNSIFIKELRNLRFIEEDQLHLTLKFLGNGVSIDSRDCIIELLKAISPDMQAPLVKIEGLQFGFPKQMIPRILFYNIEANRSMQSLTTLIHEKLMNLELSDIKREKDYKKMVYHLSIARTKHNSNRAFGRKIREIIKSQSQPINLEFIPDCLFLIKSTLYHVSAPRYEIIAKFPLQQPDKI